MSRSACTLKHLDTDDIMMSALMTEIPSLIELSLRDAEDTDEHWEALLTAIACGYLFPKLQKITCDVQAANRVITVLDKMLDLAQVPLPLYTSTRTISVDCTRPGRRRGRSKRSLSALQGKGMVIILLE